MMDFELFNDVADGLIPASESPPPSGSMILSLDEHLSLSSSLALPSSIASSSSSEYFYFTPGQSNSEEDDNLNPVDVLNMSISSLESDANVSPDAFTYLGSDKEEGRFLPAVEESEPSTTKYLDLFTMKSSHFLEELSEQKERAHEMKMKPAADPVPVSNKPEESPCKVIVPYIPPSTSSTIVSGPKRARLEQVPSSEFSSNRRVKRQLVCDICEKTFLNNSSLKQHMSFHRPQRPYKCDYAGCEKSYKTRSELNRHVIVHIGQKNYECLKCGKTFLRKQYLKTHLLRHNEGLTWQCGLCAKIFVSERDLEKHKISYHKNGKRTSITMAEQPKSSSITCHREDSLEA